MRPAVVGMAISIQAGLVVFPGFYIADRYNWAILIAPVLATVVFVAFYIITSIRNPGILPRNPTFDLAQQQADNPYRLDRSQ